MHKWLRAHGVTFCNRSNVEEIVCGSAGAEGVIVRTTGKGGRTTALRARYGIVAATGGWGQDKEFVPAYQNLECTAQPGSTATMIKALLKVGALPVMLDMFQLGSWARPDEKGADPGSFLADYAFAEGIALDRKTGSRLMNELADRRTRAEAQLRVLAKGTKDEPNYPFCFCSEETTTRAEGFEAAYREGTVKKSNTVEDLARLHHVDLAALKAVIADWNDIVAGRKADPSRSRST